MKKIRIPRLDDLPLTAITESVPLFNLKPAYSDILARINVQLIVFENTLIDPAGGKTIEFDPGDGGDGTEAMAGAAAALLQDMEPPRNVLLLLPPYEFVATNYAFSISGEKLIRSALNLQVNTLIPAYDDKLLLGFESARPQGVAVWFPEQEANRYFAAFEKENIFLSAIMPRTLILLNRIDEAGEPAAPEDLVIEDNDSAHLCRVTVRGGNVESLLTVKKTDLEIEDFAAQWNNEAGQAGANDISLNSVEDWMELQPPPKAFRSYSFFPRGAEKSGLQIQAKKRNKIISALLVIVLLGACFPFISTALEVRKWEKNVEAYREVVADIIDKQNTIFDIEEEWGALYEYPQQDVKEILLILDKEIDNSLTSLSINEGVLDIQGYAQDPAVLVETLAEEERFYNVAQSRSISGNRSARGDQFGIRMNVSGVNFDEYFEKYPEITQ